MIHQSLALPWTALHHFTYLDELQAKVDALMRLQKETGAELDALLSAVLDRAFKGEL